MTPRYHLHDLRSDTAALLRRDFPRQNVTVLVGKRIWVDEGQLWEEFLEALAHGHTEWSFCRVAAHKHQKHPNSIKNILRKAQRRMRT